MIVFGRMNLVGDEVVWFHEASGCRHNRFTGSGIGRASLPLAELDEWVDSLLK